MRGNPTDLINIGKTKKFRVCGTSHVNFPGKYVGITFPVQLLLYCTLSVGHSGMSPGQSAVDTESTQQCSSTNSSIKQLPAVAVVPHLSPLPAAAASVRQYRLLTLNSSLP